MKNFLIKNTFKKTLLIPFILGGVALVGCSGAASGSIQSEASAADALFMIKYKDNIYYSVGDQINREKFDSIKGELLGITSTADITDINTSSENFKNELSSIPDLGSNIASSVNVYSVRDDGDEKQLIAEIDNSTFEIFEK